MATSPLRLQQGYGIGNALQPLPPFSIIANRAPTQQDKARIGTFWVYTAANNVYVLTSVTGGNSNWLTLSNGGAGIFTSLIVNGPSTFNGNITQTVGVTSLLATTVTGLSNNGVFNQTGGVAIVGQIVQNTGNVSFTAPVLSNTGSTSLVNAANVLQTTCTAGGAFSIASVQLSDDNAGVLYSTYKRYSTGTITAGDGLYLNLINGQQGGVDRLAAAIDSFSQTVGAGFVSADIGFATTNIAGAVARRLVISSEGQLNINTAGQTLGIKQGANAMAGTVVLDGATGSFTQANTQVTNAGSIILLSRVNVNGASGAALTYTIVDNTSFTVTARDATTGLAVNTDASTIAYMIVQLVP